MKIIVVFLLMLICSVANATDEKSTLEKVTLQLHWKYQFEFAGFIAAKEKGFYRDAGLNVDIKEYKAGEDVQKLVLNNHATYGIYNSSTLVSYLQDKPIKLVASFFKRAALVLLVSPDIKSPKDLIGKKIMSSTKEDFILNFKPFFDGYGVDINKLEFVPHSYTTKAFEEGKVDAITAFISDQPYQLDEKGVKYNILDPSDDNLFVLQEELFTSEEEAVNHSERVQAFREASIKGWQYALMHKEELVTIIHDKYAPKISKHRLRVEARGVERLILPYTYDIGSIDVNFLNKQIEFFKKYYQIGKNKKLDDFIFHDTVTSVDTSLNNKEKEYIKHHTVVDVCLQYQQFPIDGYEDGKMIGIMSDIYKIISKHTLLRFNPIVPHSLSELKENIDTHKCDMLSAYFTRNTVYKTLRPTESFTSVHFTFMSTLDKSFISDPKLLKDKLLITQLPPFKDYLLDLYPYLNIQVESDKNKMINMVLKNKAYAVITLDSQADYIIEKYGYGKLKINGFLAKDKPVKASIGVQKDREILYSIINKVVNKIPAQKIASIENSWRINRYRESIDYSLAWKILITMGLVLAIMLYYQRKLRNFNKELAKSVYEKTKELIHINESLEATVEQKIQELIQKDEILTEQSKQAVMGEMISMIAHQWRQPLNTITLQISNLQIQQMMGEEVDKEELLETLSEISKTIVYLSNTIDDFKTYFHPNKNATRVRLSEIIDKAIKFVTPRLKGNNIAIVVDRIDDIEVNVYVNELIQVILNILNNAVDAYAKMDCDEKFIMISAKSIENSVTVSISDGAGGIKKKHIKKLFEPYFSTKGKNGTGLGLYMSRMIIEKQFGGKIEVNSADGKTTFIVSFPKNIKAK
ncbi:ABC transporter substrate-binding protein [Sulfurimonas sp.]